MSGPCRRLVQMALQFFPISVGCTLYLLNSARLHKVFQNFVVPWKIDIYKNLILSSDASRRGASNGVRVDYVNFYDK